MCDHEETTVNTTDEGQELICLQCGQQLDLVTHTAMFEMLTRTNEPVPVNDIPW